MLDFNDFNKTALRKAIGRKESNPVKKECSKNEYNRKEKVARYVAEGNISNISSAMRAIKTLIDVTFDNNNTVGFFPEDTDIKLESLPAITYEVIERTLSSKSPLSSVKTNTLKEYIGDRPTGDSFEIYTAFYDCIVEFNIYGHSKANSLELAEVFEDMLDLYKGHLKKIGLSNIYFLKEVSTKEAFSKKDFAGVSLVYNMEIQKIKSVRTNTLKSVSSTIETKIKEDNPDISEILAELSKSNTLI